MLIRAGQACKFAGPVEGVPSSGTRSRTPCAPLIPQPSRLRKLRLPGNPSEGIPSPPAPMIRPAWRSGRGVIPSAIWGREAQSRSD